MKRIVFISLILTLVLSSISCGAQSIKNQKAATAVSKNIEVYYFHYTRRCMTCNAVENESKAAIATLYPSQVKKGQITFKSVNLDEKENEVLAAKCQAEGQALLIISGTKRTDLTDKGFMYAVNSPEKLKAELKKAIDILL